MGIPVGRFRLPPHLVFEALGYAAGFQLLRVLRRRIGDPIPMVSRYAALAGAALGAVAGSKLLYLLEVPADTLAHLSDPVWLMGGKSIVGGLLGGVLGVEIAKKIVGERRSTGDLFVFPLCLGMAIGRVGCFLSGLPDRTHGVATDLPWGVDFGDGVPRHPTQLYEIAFLGALAVLCACLRPRMERPGDLFRAFMILYLSFRLLVDAIKPDRGTYLGLTGIQAACVLGLLYYGRDIRRVLAPRANIP